MNIKISNRQNSVYEVSGKMPLLQELREQGVDLPYGCQYGGCITCAAKLIEGEVDQSSQVALNNRQINNGYIILCVARPKTDCTIEIGVESHDKLYRNPFLDPLAPHELKADIASQKNKKNISRRQRNRFSARRVHHRPCPIDVHFRHHGPPKRRCPYPRQPTCRRLDAYACP